MFQRIWHWLKRLWLGWFRPNHQTPVPQPKTPSLSDTEYENRFMQLLEEVEQGWSRGNVKGFLIAQGIKEAEWVAWLGRFQEKLQESPQLHQELAQRMVQLGELGCGELGRVAQAIGSGLLGEGNRQVFSQKTEESDEREADLSTVVITQPLPQASPLQQDENKPRTNPASTEAWNQEAVALYQQGVAQHNEGRIDDALGAFKEALRIDPNFHYAWNGLGNTLDGLRRYEEALGAYREALRIDPNYHNAWYGLGNTLKDLRCYEEALAAYKEALRIRPNFHNAWNNLGATLNDLRCYEEALAAYKEALRIDPNFHNAWNNLGGTLNDLRRYEEALAAYKEALRIDPNYHIAWNGLGNTLKNLRRYEEALAAFKEVLRITDNQDWLAWLNRGWAFFASGRYEQAIQNWDEGLNKYLPTHPDSQIAYGRLHHHKGKVHYQYGQNHLQPLVYFSQAYKSYQSALEFLKDPDSKEIHLEVLQDLIKVSSVVGDDKTDEYLTTGIILLEQLILESPSPGNKLRLQRKFTGFYQLDVERLVKSGQVETAIEKAESLKNYCLRWLQEGWSEQPIASPSYAQIQQLLPADTAIIYWHISPAAITTFILRHQRPPLAWTLVANASIWGADAQLKQFEDWMREWEEDYQNTQKSKKGTKAAALGQWQELMESRLTRLGEILQIAQILPELTDIHQLILIPHRDLHLLPLHYLFHSLLTTSSGVTDADSCLEQGGQGERISHPGFTITYLPSAQVGLEQQPTHTSTEALPLLSIESPSPLLFAEIESSVIAHLYPNHLCIPSHEATKQRVLGALPTIGGIFHFTGHGSHDLDQPLNSALALANQELLTLADIFTLDFRPYSLICLSACETGMTGEANFIDEYVGLASGFLARGANYVISTLWQVQEISAALLMIRFHQYLLASDHHPPAVALKCAQDWLRYVTYAGLIQWYEDLLSAMGTDNPKCRNNLKAEVKKLHKQAEIRGENHPPYAHPYYWAGFTITGKLTP